MLYIFQPVNSNGKLIFGLCRTCCEQEKKEKCVHSTKERQFLSTWCTPEVEFAVNAGYRILKVRTKMILIKYRLIYIRHLLFLDT